MGGVVCVCVCVCVCGWVGGGGGTTINIPALHHCSDLWYCNTHSTNEYCDKKLCRKDPIHLTKKTCVNSIHY